MLRREISTTSETRIRKRIRRFCFLLCQATGTSCYKIKCNRYITQREIFVRSFIRSSYPFHFQSQGFCFFINIGIAAKYAQTQYGVGKVAVLDFDVHHGNGTGTARIFPCNISVKVCNRRHGRRLFRRLDSLLRQYT